MTASNSPDENPYPPKEAGSHEPTGFVYDDPSAPPEAEPTYVPEREFVLMPLFRRIGELLGIRRHEEPEYIYESTAEGLHVQVDPARQIAGFGRQEAAVVHEEPTLVPEPVQNLASHWEPPTAGSTPEPEVVPNLVEHIAFQAQAPAPETRPEPFEAEEIEAGSAHFEPSHQYEATAEAHPPETSPQVLEAGAPTAQQRQPKRQKAAPQGPDEIDEAIAILREAGSKVSTAISQAMEWLSAKEAELVRQAERSLAPAPKRRRVPGSAGSATPRQPARLTESMPAPLAEASEPEIAPESPSAPKSEPLQFPSLQREVAWKGMAESAAGQPVATPQPPSYPVRPRPALVPRRPQVPFWKHIDWAGEFTPKRVAVLGGVVMALLIVAGITFARRPASDVLPPQTHAIHPGGVTLTTHPAATTTARAPQHHRVVPPAQRAVAPAPRRPQRAPAYDEPDVVTHYYKQKPSPSKQSTVAGVKHYSDVN